MTRDELLSMIKDEVCKVLPENEQLEGEELETVNNVVDTVINDAVEALDSAEDAENEEEPTTSDK